MSTHSAQETHQEIARRISESFAYPLYSLNRVVDFANTAINHIEALDSDLRSDLARLSGRIEKLEKENNLLTEAASKWLAETSPGQHINTAKGRTMMLQAVKEVERLEAAYEVAS